VTWTDHETREIGRLLDMMEISLTAAQAVTISKAIAPAISKDKTRPHLLGVQIAPIWTTAGVRINVTDSFRLHSVVVETTDAEWPDAVVPAGAELVKALQAAAKADKTGRVTIQCAGEDAPALMVTNGQRFTQCVDLYKVTYPNVDELLARTLETELPAAFDGDYFADLMAAAQVVGSHETRKGQAGRPVEIHAISSKQCCQVTSQSYDETISFTGLLMPQRIR